MQARIEESPQVSPPLTVRSGASGIRPQILVAEHDVPLGNFLRRKLQAESYQVDLASDGELAMEAANRDRYHLLIVDADLHQGDGISLVKQLRASKPRLPILTLTGRSQVEDRVQSLDSGADDCLSKPFAFSELSARIRALLRRNGESLSGTLKVADLILNRSEFRVERAGVPINLTAKEFALLEFLMKHEGETVSRANIMDHVWGAPYDPSTNLVDVYVKYVRDKVDAAMFHQKLIRTVRGVGYVLTRF